MKAPQDARFAVHRAMAARSDCVSSAERAKAPEKYVYTSNLLVRRDVFDSEAFLSRRHAQHRQAPAARSTNGRTPIDIGDGKAAQPQ